MDAPNFLWSERYLLIDGIIRTLQIAFFALVFSVIFGLLIGFLRYINNSISRFVFRLHLELFRIIPLIVWLFALFFALPTALGFTISSINAAIIVFSVWGAAEMGEIARAALTTLPKIQKESAQALGLGSFASFVYILLPQATIRLLPGIINMATRLVKTTSMASLIGVLEIITRGRHIIERTSEPFVIYVFIFFFFFVLCYPLSILAKHMEKKAV